MKHRIILRLKTTVNINQTKEALKCLFAYSLKSILDQTNQHYSCVIQYPKASESLVNEEKQKYIYDPNKFFFTSNMNEVVKALLAQPGLEAYEDLLFVKLVPDQVYPKDMIDELHHYTPNNKTRTLLLQKGYTYYLDEKSLYQCLEESSGTYIYRCRIDEYRKHFCVYDYYYPSILDKKYALFKKELLELKILTIKSHIDNNELKKTTLIMAGEKDKVLAQYGLTEV